MKYGLLGERLTHSFSPMIHEKLGNRDYALCPVAKEAFAAFMEARDFQAINVTIPYKQAVIPYLDRISAEASAIGSVNTIVKEADGSLSGYNTDFAGLLYAARNAGVSMRGKRVLILGNGGTSLTARAAARADGASEILIASRNGGPEGAGASEDAEYGAKLRFVSYESLRSIGKIGVLINTTPVGMYPNNGKALLSLTDFPGLCGVIDVIYNPFRTALLLEAEKLGIPHTNGLPMLVAQAKYASDLFFGKAPEEGPAAFALGTPLCREKHGGKEEDDARQIDAITAELSAALSNVVLVGMPSVGKSSVGKALSALLGKKFVDLDAEIVARSGKSIPEIFQEEGEPGFRERESLIAAEYGKERGLVIACGGGTVLRAENRSALRQNGWIVHLMRPLSMLSTEGRPLSKDQETLRRMYEERYPIYHGIADATMENTDSVEACAARIAAAYRAQFPAAML